MYDYDFHTYSVRRKRSKGKVVFSFLGVLCIIGFLVWFIIGNSQNGSNNKEETNVLSADTQEISNEKKENSDTLSAVVQQALLGSTGSYAVVIKNLKTGESYSFNEHVLYESASLYKLWVMAVVFEQIKSGKIKEDTSLVADVQALNKKFAIASESAELSEGKLSFTTTSALRQMITISHNYAALALTEKVKLSSVREFLTKKGFDESKVGTTTSAPVTTAYEIALFLEKLINGELADETHTSAMLDLLKGQMLNEKLPRYLPENVAIAHKTGELGQFSHDAGIVFTPSGNYIIVVLSKSNFPPGAEERIADISRAVYEYFVR